MATAASSGLLVDTGPGSTDGSNGLGLFSTGDTGCTPDCSQEFQNIAAQFTLAHAASLDGVQFWTGGYRMGGSIDIKIYSDHNGIPGTVIYSQTYPVTTAFANIDWLAFSNYGAVLAAGTYWLGLEPTPNTATDFGGIYGGAPNPLAKYAIWNGPTGYRSIQASIGIRISGANYPDLTFGTAGRATMAGAVFGIGFNNDYTSGGAGQVSVVQGAGAIPAGWSIVRAGLIQNGLSTGSWSGASICFNVGGGCTEGVGSGRSVAFRSFTNQSAQSLTFQVNAVLDGQINNFGGSTGSASGNIYVLDPTKFTTAVNNSGTDAAHFLLNSVPNSQDLSGLFPSGTVLASANQALTGPPGQALTADLTTGLITVQPGATVLILFDVAVNTPAGNSIDFFSTLAPASVFFTDTNGDPVTQLLAMGPATPAVNTAATLTLTQTSSSSAAGTSHSVTVTATDSGGNPVVGSPVMFQVFTGPNSGASGAYVTDSNGQAVFTYTDASDAGTDVIQAHIGTLTSNTLQQTWTSPGPLDHITVSPSSASVSAGVGQSYTTQAFDVFGHSLGDATSSTVFTIAPDGTCTGASCMAAATGSHTVTADDGGKTAQATLMIGVASTNTCDINSDGAANVVDVQTIADEVLGFLSPVHDLNQDHVVDVNDVQAALNASLGLGCPL